MRIAKFLFLVLISGVLCGRIAFAQDDPGLPAAPPIHARAANGTVANGTDADSAAATALARGTEIHGGAVNGGAAHGGAVEEPRGTFDPEHGTWINWLVGAFTGQRPHVVQNHGQFEVENVRSIRYDYFILALIVMLMVGLLATRAAKKATIRPEGKPHSLPNAVEAAVEGFREYLVGIMGRDLAYKYAPLISSFFFTILFMNWLGLIPGLISPTANPNIPISLALVAFVCVHVIAIREAGLKSWFMHFVGEPRWLAPLNFPLHIVGELVKPVSLAMRLLCNVFGEEMVIGTLTLLAVTALPVWLPIPFQLPMLFLGTFFGMLQALVFATLLAIYIAIFATHHDAHDAHNVNGTVEHVNVGGHDAIVAHPSQTTVG